MAIWGMPRTVRSATRGLPEYGVFISVYEESSHGRFFRLFDKCTQVIDPHVRLAVA